MGMRALSSLGFLNVQRLADRRLDPYHVSQF